ncbi:tRNA lysidine(34) synthetase TilS [Chitinophagaceae bacterium LWZ2-11]
MTDLLQQFKAYREEHFPQFTANNTKLLLAVSGGADSVVLTDLVYRAGFDFVILHCNFQLRGAESTRDEQFVKELGKHYGKEVLVEVFDTLQYSSETKQSIEEAARTLRYEWFETVKGERLTVSSDRHLLIVTAHHANDNIETVLMKFFRGTGIKGLRGILPYQKERSLIRPLLRFTKNDLLKYAKDNKLSFVEDSSNASDDYTRNFFRNKLIPAIKEVFPQTEENILHNIDRLQEVEQLYRQAIDLHKAKLIEVKNDEIHIPILKLKKAEPLKTIVWEITKDYSFSANQTDEVIKLFNADNGAFTASATHRIIKNRNWLIIAPKATEEAFFVAVEKDDKEVVFQNGKLSFKIEQASSHVLKTADNSIAALDLNDIKYPLLLRKWKQGDYFYPLGMRKKKKLSKFFIDLKLSTTDKEKVWVLESNKKIMWVIGYRIDDRFKITEVSKELLVINFQ